MAERNVTIRLGIQDNIGDRLLEIKKQRDALLSKSTVNLKINSNEIDKARKASAQVRAESAAAMKELSALSDSITSKAVTPLAQYQNLMTNALRMTRTMGTGIVSALRGISAEFERQKNLANFWGTSGGMFLGVTAIKNMLAEFLAGSGTGFTNWLKDVSGSLTQYRTALASSATVLVGFAAAAGLSSKHTQNYIQATLSTRLMERKLTDRRAAEAWIESAQGTDWSAGRASRMSVFQTVLSKNPYIGQKGAQKATEDIEKYFFANQEMLRKKGFESAEQLASAISAPQLSGEEATKFEDIFGLGFSRMTPQARLGRLSTEAQGIDMSKAVAMRPDEVLTKRLTATTQAMGDTVLPVLNQVLGAFLAVSDAIGKIPGVGNLIGWATVLGGMASAGLIVVSMIGSMVPGLITVISLISKLSLITKMAAAAQWLLNVAMTANPIGIAIVAIAALVAGLYVLEKKFGLVSKAWHAFSKIDIGKGIMNAPKMILELMTSSNPVMKTIVIILDFIRKLWTSSTALNKLFSSGLVLWQRVVDFFTWVLDVINTGVKHIKESLTLVEGLKNWLVQIFERLIGAITALPGTISAAIKSWFPGAGGSEDHNRSPAETQAGMAVEAKAPGAYVMGPNEQQIRPSQWPMQYLFDKSGEFGSKTVYGPGGAELGTVQDFMTKEAAFDAIIQAAKAGGRPEGIPGISFGADTWLDLINSNRQTYPAMQEIYDRLVAGNAGVNIASDPFGNQYLAPTAPETFKNQGSMYVAFGNNGLFDVWNASGLVSSGFKTEQEAKDYIRAHSMAVGGQIRASGALIGHGGEEIDSAKIVAGGKTTLARINELFSSGKSYAGSSITIQAPPVNINIDRIEKDVDVDRLFEKAGDEFDRKLLFRLRNALNTMGLRDIGYLRG